MRLVFSLSSLKKSWGYQETDFQWSYSATYCCFYGYTRYFNVNLSIRKIQNKQTNKKTVISLLGKKKYLIINHKLLTYYNLVLLLTCQLCKSEAVYCQSLGGWGQGKSLLGLKNNNDTTTKQTNKIINHSILINLLKFTYSKLSNSLLSWKFWPQTLQYNSIKTTI